MALRPALHLLAALTIFTAAFAVRRYFFCGLLLGDDGQEYAIMLHVLGSGPNFRDQMHLRFAIWVFNYLAFVLFGVSETTFVLPNWVLSSALGVIAYALLLRWRRRPLEAFLGALFVVTAPFEVLVGTLRVNDLFLGVAIAVGLWALVRFEARPVLQGTVLALCLWFGFYVKLWAVYTLPALGWYYLAGRRWRGLAAVAAATAAVHGATCAYWYHRIGTFVPFIETHAANWAVPRERLGEVWLTYPRLVFLGSSEFGTTLFGAVPYLVVGLLAVKVLATALGASPNAALRLDRADRILVALWGSFFLLLEFFPNGFKLDAYYSVPRIFRYLTPVSFPMTLHAAKLLLDLASAAAARGRPALAALAVLVPMIALNLRQTDAATKPGQIYRRAFLAVLRDVQAACPPKLVAEALVASYFRDLYLDPESNRTDVVILYRTYSAQQYESWLRANEDSLPEGTMLVTGLASFVHYGAHEDGFRLTRFSAPLGPRWELVEEYDVLTFLPRPEPARLWRLRGGPPDTAREEESGREDVSSLEGIDDMTQLARGAMERYGRQDYPAARVYFRKVIDEFPEEAADAQFFYAATFLREARWSRARREFKRLIVRYPGSTWVATAHWHLATCDRNLGSHRRARLRLEYVLRRHRSDPTVLRLAAADLRMLNLRRGGWLGSLRRGQPAPRACP